jgi:hypothetical protein
MRLVAAGWATDEEICRSWSLAKVFDYNELLDMQEDSELRAAEARKDATEFAGE